MKAALDFLKDALLAIALGLLFGIVLAEWAVDERASDIAEATL